MCGERHKFCHYYKIVNPALKSTIHITYKCYKIKNYSTNFEFTGRYHNYGSICSGFWTTLLLLTTKLRKTSKYTCLVCVYGA